MSNYGILNSPQWKDYFGGDILKIRVNPKGNFVGAAKIKAVLREDFNSGSVLSVSAVPQKTETFRIKLKPATNHDVVYKICKKLNNTGYHTKVVSVGLQASGRPTGGFR